MISKHPTHHLTELIAVTNFQSSQESRIRYPFDALPRPSLLLHHRTSSPRLLLLLHVLTKRLQVRQYFSYILCHLRRPGRSLSLALSRSLRRLHLSLAHNSACSLSLASLAASLSASLLCLSASLLCLSATSRANTSPAAPDCAPAARSRHTWS